MASMSHAKPTSDIRKLPRITMTVKRPPNRATPPKPSKIAKRPAIYPSNRYLTHRYKIHGQIGSGSFGTIFKAWDRRLFTEVAIKVDYSSDDDDKDGNDVRQAVVNAMLEKKGIETNSSVDEPRHSQQLRKEKQLYKYLKDQDGFPHLYASGRLQLALAKTPRPFLVMSMLGQNLDELFEQCDRQWSVATRAQIAIQLLDRLEAFHDITGHIHRDIKPENLMMGVQGTCDDRLLHLIDLGLAKEFRLEREDGPRGSGLTGTARYASISAHKSKPMSRKDDLEAAAYMLLYFSRGSLPWQGFQGPKKRRNQYILEIKQQMTSTQLCAGVEPPFKRLLDYARTLPFSARPDYRMLRREFRTLLPADYRRDHEPVFDWDQPANGDREDEVQVVYDSGEIITLD